MSRNEQIIAAYQAGETQQQIAVRFGMSQTGVSKVVSKAGVGRGRGARIVPREARLLYDKLRRVLGVEAARREIGL